MAGASVQPSERRRQFNLGWAVGISVLLHLLLGLLSGWIPVVRPVEVAVAPEQSVLRFTFKQPSEDAVEEAAPRGEVPFETPQPRPSVDPTPPPPDPGFQASPEVPPAAEQRPPRPSESAAPPARERAREAAEAPRLADLPEGTRAPFLREREVEPGAAAKRPETAERSFDIDRAIQDFGRRLDQAREQRPPTPQGQGPPRNVFVPDPQEVVASGYGLGNLTFETADFDWSDYARAVYVQIWRAWHNRLLRLVDDFEKWSYVNREPFIDHSSQVVFVIERSGEVTGIGVETPSGCIPLDQSATQALEEVILPPLPEAFPKEREVVHARFLANGEIRYMRPMLTRMKALNYF